MFISSTSLSLALKKILALRLSSLFRQHQADLLESESHLQRLKRRHRSLKVLIGLISAP